MEVTCKIRKDLVLEQMSVFIRCSRKITKDVEGVSI